MASSSRLSLSPFPSATTAAYPDLPLAASLTVARLASPYSINKAFLPLFLEALKHWFKGRKRIIKKGDLVAVGICEDEARFSLTGEEERVMLVLFYFMYLGLGLSLTSSSNAACRAPPPNRRPSSFSKSLPSQCLLPLPPNRLSLRME